MRVPVIWWNANPEAIARGYWDQALLEDVFARRAWRPPDPIEFDHYDSFDEWDDARSAAGAMVVVVPARHNATAVRVEALQADLDRYVPALVILTGDEEGVYPWRDLEAPGRAVWHMNGRPSGQHLPDRYLGSGYSPGTRETLHGLTDRRVRDYAFLGQVTHERRHECVEGLNGVRGNGLILETEGFTQGVPRDEYLRTLAETRIAPCPAGPESPDSFRLYEALEAGCVPIIDLRTRYGNAADYWNAVAAGAPFPALTDWRSLPETIPGLLTEWPARAAACAAWWVGYKRDLAHDLDATVRRLAGVESVPEAPDDQITVIVVTSPVVSNPSTSMIEETVASIRSHLPDAEIILAADGVRPEQEARRPEYEEFLRRLTILAQREWSNVVPVFLPEWGHQANLTRAALTKVRTPLILFVEHDTPLTGPELPIEWERLCGLVLDGDFDLIRLHHETAIGDYHEHMMLRNLPTSEANPGLVIPTFQWSQRPHVASRAFYERVIDTYFGRDSRTMIEDLIHGVVSSYWTTFGETGWQQFRLGIYAPTGGNIQRSTHSDGRAGAPKWGMRYSYDGRDTPAYAPGPTTGGD